jgi:hypothetical protein
VPKKEPPLEHAKSLKQKRKREEGSDCHACFFFLIRTAMKLTTANAAATPMPMTAHGILGPVPLFGLVGGFVGGTFGG